MILPLNNLKSQLNQAESEWLDRSPSKVYFNEDFLKWLEENYMILIASRCKLPTADVIFNDEKRASLFFLKFSQ